MHLTFQSSLQEEKGKVQTRSNTWADPSTQPAPLRALAGAELVAVIEATEHARRGKLGNQEGPP